MCFVCSKEPSHRDHSFEYLHRSFEYPQHMFWLRNKKKISYALLSGGLNIAKLANEKLQRSPI